MQSVLCETLRPLRLCAERQIFLNTEAQKTQSSTEIFDGFIH